MKRVMVRYRVKADSVAENERLVRAVYDELKRKQPGGLRYATFKLADGVSFVHLAVIEGDANPLSQVAAFKEFQRGIAERCVEPPAAVDVTEIGTYRFLGA